MAGDPGSSDLNLATRDLDPVTRARCEFAQRHWVPAFAGMTKGDENGTPQLRHPGESRDPAPVWFDQPNFRAHTSLPARAMALSTLASLPTS